MGGLIFDLSFTKLAYTNMSKLSTGEILRTLASIKLLVVFPKGEKADKEKH